MPQDYKLDAVDDLVITSGDFVIAESTQQHQSLLVRAKKGELRQYPKTGVGVDDFLNDDNPGDVWQEIQKQYEADGMIVRKIEIGYVEAENKIEPKVDAYYP